MKAEQLIAEKGIEYACKVVELAPKMDGIQLVLIDRVDYILYTTKDLKSMYDSSRDIWRDSYFSIRNEHRDMVDIDELRNAIS